MKKQSQCNQILKLLKQANKTKNKWVPLPRILRLGAAQYNVRIMELRERGHRIVNDTVWLNGECRSWYRIYE